MIIDSILDTSLNVFFFYLQLTLTVCYSLYFADQVTKGCLFDRLIITYFLVLKEKKKRLRVVT